MGLFTRNKKKTKSPGKGSVLELKESQVLTSLTAIETTPMKDWSTDDVVVWIQITLGYKFYGSLFLKNNITGNKLSSLTPFDMNDIGIRNVDHCAAIFKQIASRSKKTSFQTSIANAPSGSSSSFASVSTASKLQQIVVKLSHENAVKRVKVGRNCRLDQLESIIFREFKQKNLGVYWLDNDNDLISVDSTEVLWDVFQENPERVKFQIYTNQISETASMASSSSNDSFESSGSSQSLLGLDTTTSFYEGNDMRNNAQITRFFSSRHHKNMKLQYAAVVIDTLGIIKCWNMKAEELFGYTMKEAIGQNVKLIMTKNIAKRHDGFLRRYAEERGKSRVIGVGRCLMAKHKSGESVPIFLTVNEASEPFPFYTAIITKSDTVSNISKDDIDYSDIQTLEKLPLAAIIANHKGKIQYCNIAFCKLFGYEAAQVLGKNLKMLMPEPFASQHKKFMRRYQKTGEVKVVGKSRSLPAKRADGTSLPIVLNVHENKEDGPDGMSTFTGIINEVENDSDESSDDDDLATIEQHLELINWLNDAHIIIKADGLIYGINKKALTLFEYDKSSELVGKNITTIFWNQVDVENHPNYINKFLKTGEKAMIGTLKTVCGKTKTGKLVNVRLRIKHHCDQNGFDFFVGALLE